MARFNTALTSASISGTATIGSPGAGAFTNLTGTAPYTVTVPNPTLFPGVNQVFYNATSGTITLTTPSGNFNGTGGNGTASMSIFAGNVVSITSDGTHYIVISEDGSALTATTGAFSGNVTMNGSGATVSITPSTLTVAPTGASTIDSVAIGSTTRAAGAFTSLAANAAVTLTAGTASSTTGTGTLVVTGGIGASGQVTASAVSATNLTGTLQTAAQPNITSHGTLTGLAVTGATSLATTSGTVLIGTATTNANGVLQLSGSLGMGANSEIRLSSNADAAGTLKVFATHLVAGGINSFASGYTEEGRIASLSNGDSVVAIDVGRGQTTFALGAARFRAFNTGGDNAGFSLSKSSVYTIYADTTSGRVGIGTNSPGVSLEVAGAAKLTGTNLSIVPSTTTNPAYLVNTNASGNFFFGIDNSTGSSFGVGNYARAIYSSAAYPLVFLTNDTSRMTISATGAVGIATTPNTWFSNRSALQFGGAVGAISSANGMEYGLNFYVNVGDAIDKYIQAGRALKLHADAAEGALVFSNAATGTTGANLTWNERLRVDTVGRMGIGTNFPLTKLQVTNGNIVADSSLRGSEVVTSGASSTTGETNALGGWALGYVNLTITSVGTTGGVTPQNGSYMISLTGTNVNNGARADYAFSVVAGKRYQVSYYTASGTGHTAGYGYDVYIASSGSLNVDNYGTWVVDDPSRGVSQGISTTTAWVQTVWSVSAAKTGTYYLSFRVAGNQTGNTQTFIDSLSIKEIQGSGAAGGQIAAYNAFVGNTLYANNVTATSMSSNTYNGASYAATSTTSSMAIVDTGITNYGNGAVYQVHACGCCNVNGSGSYLDQVYGKVVIGTGYSGSAVTNYIYFVQENMPRPYDSGGTELTIDAVYWDGTTETTNQGAGGSRQIRIKVGFPSAQGVAGFNCLISRVI
jgi:hypothetical protein